ncbi:unnamed protein product, partial [Ectocarpus sp. 12 AP-2014]
RSYCNVARNGQAWLTLVGLARVKGKSEPQGSASTLRLVTADGGSFRFKDLQTSGTSFRGSRIYSVLCASLLLGRCLYPGFHKLSRTKLARTRGKQQGRRIRRRRHAFDENLPPWRSRCTRVA